MGIKLEMVNGRVATCVPDPQKQGEPDLIDEHGTKQWRPDWSRVHEIAVLMHSWML